MTEKKFPEGFHWGAATAPHQVEGNNYASDIWQMEHVPGSLFTVPSGDTTDFYHRYRDDIAMAADHGLNALRLGVEWARIEPEQGHVSNAELDHYRRVMDAALELGITPVVTLYHFTSPRWVTQQRGWENPDTAKWAAGHASRVVEALGDRVSTYFTINEINTPQQVTGNGLLTPELEAYLPKVRALYANALGLDKPEDFNPFLPFAGSDQAVKVLLDAHSRMVDAVHAGNKDAEVGVTISMQEHVAEPGGEEFAKAANEKLNLSWLRSAGAVGDFVAVQNYTRHRYNSQGRITETENMEDAGYTMAPESLGATVRLAHEVTGKPIWVTEHGADLPTARDAERAAFITASLGGLHDAISDGVPVAGYVHWSLTDNWEWVRGYDGHFGLAEVDLETFERTPRPSFTTYGEIAKANALP